MSSISPVSVATSGVHYNLSISYGSSRQDISLNESTYLFTAPEGALPCEVYNFSVTATYVGATYNGAGYIVHSEALYLRNPLGTDEFWTEVNLLGELILNITVEVN